MKKSFSNRVKASVSILALVIMMLSFSTAAFAGPFDTVPVDMSLVEYAMVDTAGIGKLKMPTSWMLEDTYSETGYYYNFYQELSSELVGYRYVTLEYAYSNDTDVERAAKELYNSVVESIEGYIGNPYFAGPTMIKCGDQEVWMMSLWFYFEVYYEYSSWVLMEGPEGVYMISINDTVPQVSEVKSMYDELIDSMLAVNNPKNVGNKAYSRYLETFKLW